MSNKPAPVEQLNAESTSPGQTEEQGRLPRLHWEMGTAYDFFLSLEILHKPEEHSLRPSWAAGVRSRLAPAERKVLDLAVEMIWVPIHWLDTLPAPRDAASVLWALRQIPPAERLPLLGTHPDYPEELRQILQGVQAKGAWNDTDLQAFRSTIRATKGKSHEIPSVDILKGILDAWSSPAQFGEQYLEALQSYYRVFFAEEEQRILPALQDGIRKGQELAKRLPLLDLIEKLSQGIRFQERIDTPELVFIPSYWITPLIAWQKSSPERFVMIYGARPAYASLVPGEVVPDALLRGLKAVADPTRLKILRFLSQEPLTPADLARSLRLRAPTVTHHLSALRLAGLVHLFLEAEGERRYTTRQEGIDDLCLGLHEFLVSQGEDQAPD